MDTFNQMRILALMHFTPYKKESIKKSIGLNDYDHKKSFDDRDIETYTLKDIHRYPGLENAKAESIKCYHSALRELSLLYSMLVNDTALEFIQKTGVLPSAFVNYFMALEQTGIRNKRIPSLVFDSTYKKVAEKTNYDFGGCILAEDAHNYFPI